MSFILEALKKSEQQRQQKKTPPAANKRTIALQEDRQKMNPYGFLVFAMLLLALLIGWGVYALQDSPETAPVASNPSPQPPVVTSEPTPQPKPAAPEVTSVPQTSEPSVLPLEPAPVPRPFSQRDEARENAAPERLSQNVIISEDVETVLIADDGSASSVQEVVEEDEFADVPLYSELSQGLRDRMPQLDMSLHFYMDNPERRLTRINNRILREGDMINQDLQVVKVTPDGVVLDYLGMLFLMPGSER